MMLVALLQQFNLNFRWLQSVMGYFSLLNTNFSAALHVSAEAVLLELAGDAVPVIYARLLYDLLCPLVNVALITAVCGLLRRLQPFAAHCSECCRAATIVVVLMFYPNVAYSLLSLVSCLDFGDQSFISANASYACWTRQHVLYSLVLVVPGIALWLFVIPLTFLWYRLL